MSIIGRTVVTSNNDVGVVVDKIRVCEFDEYIIDVDGEFKNVECFKIECFLEKYKGDNEDVLSILKDEQERRKKAHDYRRKLMKAKML